MLIECPLLGRWVRGLEEHLSASPSIGTGRKESASIFLSASTWMLLSAFSLSLLPEVPYANTGVMI